MFDLTNKVAVVTGGASGIGRAIVERFIQAGAKVLLVDRNEAQVEGAFNAIQDAAPVKEVPGVNVTGINGHQ